MSKNTKPIIPGGYYIRARKIKESEIAHAPPYIREIWDWLLREANHSKRISNGRSIERGQLVRTYKDIMEGLSWFVGFRKERYTRHQVGNAMRWLRDHLMITTRKTTRGVLISICNYGFYQDPANYEYNIGYNNGNKMLQQPPATINKNGKNGKNEKNEKKKELKPSASQEQKPKKSNIKKKDKKTNPDIRIFIDNFFNTFKAKTGTKYLVTGKDANLVKRLLGTYSLQELIKLKDLFFESEDNFIQQAGFTIGVFSSCLNKIISTMEYSKLKGKLSDIGIENLRTLMEWAESEGKGNGK